MSTEDWLSRDVKTGRHGRLARLQWLVDNTPHGSHWRFPGGLVAKYLFDEARYCFVYGQFLATTVLGVAYIEHTLGGLFCEEGRNDLERASLGQLLGEALACGWIAQAEYANLHALRNTRNLVSHVRRPLDPEAIDVRAVFANEVPYTIVEEDARHVVAAALRLADWSTYLQLSAASVQPPEYAVCQILSVLRIHKNSITCTNGSIQARHGRCGQNTSARLKACASPCGLYNWAELSAITAITVPLERSGHGNLNKAARGAIPP